ncbi:hypothetical protein FB45DRAFT_866571 [Roridomyces roridus]|uniref:Uncharacterized protein n=1 Tax=Roridomyces roridus TaxID=1738132 RepID=A0AAD7FQE3_9AGAR|nr:hypothetical protein FB45DRAFT_866571 [Roridomyces roridus]
MTEYTTSSQAIRDYLSSKERTKYWVHSRAEPPEDCYSPSIPPSILEDPDFAVPISPPSDVGSTHSVPPKMVLRYTDGRPDEPIPYPYGTPPDDRHHKSKSRPREQRSHTLPTPPQSHSGSHHGRGAPRVPEEIRVLPSAGLPKSSHSRSKSLPRDAFSQAQEPIPAMPPMAGLPGPLPHPGPLVTFSQPHPQAWGHPASGSDGSHGRRRRAPPPIVYAPSHRSRPHYAPPAIYTHPPNMGPNGMIYSHSAPVPSAHYSHYPPKNPTPYPSVMAPSTAHMSTVEEERRSGSRTPHGHHRSHSRARQRSPASSSSSVGSNDSGGTYYVMPQPGQRVHVIHTPDASSTLYTSSSTAHSRSPTSPRSGSSLKKPFFQRLLQKSLHAFSPSSGGDRDSSRGSSRGGRRLHRRHSTGGSGSGRSRSVPPGE